MIQVGSKVRIKEDIDEKLTGISEESCEDYIGLKEMRGKETIIVDISPDRSSFHVELDPEWCFEEDWLEEIKESENNEN